MATKTWIIKLEIELDENSHPSKFIPDTINECLDYGGGEDITNIEYVCLD